MKFLSSENIIKITSSVSILTLESAIKELIENSLDAESDSIQVKLVDYGLESISVVDNGFGLSSNDLIHFGQRNHTSKISEFSDIESAPTFGFRGEAISSLCAVSDLFIITATALEEPKGTRIHFDQMGRRKKTFNVARSKGTTVQLENLFKNSFPVRRNDLEKKIKYYFSQVVRLMQGFCLCHPHVRFSLSNSVSGTLPNSGTTNTPTNTKNSKKRLQPNLIISTTNNKESILNRFTNLFGISVTQNMIPFNVNIPVDAKEPWELTISGLISKPVSKCGKPTPDTQFISVQSRIMEIPKLNKSLNTLYREFNDSQYPAFVFFLTIPTDKFDRNVSPDKKTLIWQNEVLILDGIRQAIYEIFVPFRGRFSTSLSTNTTIATTHTNTNTRQLQIPWNLDDESLQGHGSQEMKVDTNREPRAPCPFKAAMAHDSPSALTVDLDKLGSALKAAREAPSESFEFKDGQLETPLFIHKSDFGSMRVIGQFNLGFILVAYTGYLFIVDQHASQEKFLYEKYCRLVSDKKISIQKYIQPKVIKVDMARQALLGRIQGRLRDQGFEVKPRVSRVSSDTFDTEPDDQVWELLGVPQIRNTVFGLEDLYEILDALIDCPPVSDKSPLPLCKRMVGVFASKACRTAVMIGDALTKGEMMGIVSDMQDCEQPFNCPHGRPTIRLLGKINSA